jgi:hypothetical protein
MPSLYAILIIILFAATALAFQKLNLCTHSSMNRYKNKGTSSHFVLANMLQENNKEQSCSTDLLTFSTTSNVANAGSSSPPLPSKSNTYKSKNSTGQISNVKTVLDQCLKTISFVLWVLLLHPLPAAAYFPLFYSTEFSFVENLSMSYIQQFAWISISILFFCALKILKSVLEAKIRLVKTQMEAFAWKVQSGK